MRCSSLSLAERNASTAITVAAVAQTAVTICQRRMLFSWAWGNRRGRRRRPASWVGGGAAGAGAPAAGGDAGGVGATAGAAPGHADPAGGTPRGSG